MMQQKNNTAGADEVKNENAASATDSKTEDSSTASDKAQEAADTKEPTSTVIISSPMTGIAADLSTARTRPSPAK